MADQEKIRMSLLFKMCAYYNHPLGDGDNPDPKVEVAKRYFMIIPLYMINRFYDKIISNCEFFPSKVKLSEIYNSMVQYQAPERIAPDNQLTFDGAAQKYIEANGVPEECPAENQELTGDDMVRDSRVLTDEQMMRKYGFKRMYPFWREQADKLTDADWEQRDRERDELVRKHCTRDSFYTK